MSGITCALAGASGAAFPGGSDSEPISGTPGTSLASIMATPLTVPVASDGSVHLEAPYTFQPTSTSNMGAATRWYRLIGATWTAIGTEVASTSDAYIVLIGNPPIDGYAVPGAGNNVLDVSGLTPGASEQFKLYGRTGASGSGMSGTATGTSD